MGVREFQQHLEDVSPAFRCTAYAPSMLVPVRHKLGKPATTGAIKALHQLCGPDAAKGLADFYSLFDGADLYRFRRECAFRFFPIALWSKRTADYFASLEQLDDFGRLLKRPSKLVIFGEVPRSGNFFAVRTGGAAVGSILYLKHDAPPCRFASSFSALLDRLRKDPVRFIEAAGSFTHYFTAGTNAPPGGWFPKQYLTPSSKKPLWLP